MDSILCSQTYYFIFLLEIIGISLSILVTNFSFLFLKLAFFVHSCLITAKILISVVPGASKLQK